MRVKGLIVRKIAVLCLMLATFIPASPVLAATPLPSPDLDADGLSNDMETGGWYNLAGGPFVTDALDSDSDNDGLSDAEEKLYNTHPLDDKSPGIYARYQTGYMTRQYFRTSDPAYLAFVQGGDRYLLTEAIVARRGTTISIGGPLGANLQITGSGLTSLSPVKNTCAGGWTVSLPSNGTVGTYTATMTLGGWSESMPLHVIFQLPAPSPSDLALYNLSQASINTFLYDDDPSNIRDERSVWFRVDDDDLPRLCVPDPDHPELPTYPPPCSQDYYHSSKGYAQAFISDQFKKSVFLTHAMPAISGQTSQATTVNVVTAWADREYRVVFDGAIHDTFASAMYKWNDGTGIRMDGGACQDNANVLTTILRSAGIPARTFIKDYNKTPGHGEAGQIGSIYEYDHSVMMWIGDHWRVARSFATGESGDLYYPWDHGYRSVQEFYNYYTDDVSDAIVTANDGWDRSSQGGMVNDDLYPSHQDVGAPGRWDYYWFSDKPLEIKQSPYVSILNYESWNGDGWAPSEWQNPPVSDPPGMTATQTYYLPPGVPAYVGDLENWPYNPVPIACSPSTPPAVCAAFMSGMGGMAFSELPATPPAGALPLSASELQAEPAGPVQIEAVTGDQGVDLDGDGRFDKLVIQVSVNVAQAGTYTFGAGLEVDTAHPIAADHNRLSLEAGVHTIELSFNGESIGRNQVDGPYRVADVWVTDQEDIQPETIALDRQRPDYATASYAADDFETPAALFGADFSHQGLDGDGDGYYEALVIQVPLKIWLPGTYRVEGDLYDGQSNFVGHATWTGSGPSAALQFTVKETSAPYQLENLILVDPNGALFDSRFANAYTVADLAGRVDQGALSLESAPSDGVSGLDVTPTYQFTVVPRDTNGNGSYDQLAFKVGVNVTNAGGNYRIEGLLVDENSTPVAWSVSGPQSLQVGTGELELAFDGRILYDHMPFSPATQSFKLVAVKIFSGNLSPATLEDQVAVATTTPAYTRDDFEHASPGSTLFEDNMENGTSQWNKTGSWSLSSNAWHSRSNAWRASGADGLLRTDPISIDVSSIRASSLRFSTCYNLQSSSVGAVEISTNNGSSWTPLETYTGATGSWVTRVVDLHDYERATSLQIRFNADYQDSLLWYIDDVSVDGKPPVDYTYLPIVRK